MRKKARYNVEDHIHNVKGANWGLRNRKQAHLSFILGTIRRRVDRSPLFNRL